MKKVILVTGGSSGIGKFLIKNLAKRNFFVINLSRKKTLIRSKNYQNIILENFNNHEKLKIIFKSIEKKHKRIFGLINNAGATFEGYSFKNFKNNLDINLNFTFNVTNLALPLIVRGGKIINISSIASYVGLPNNPGYNASKAAINSLTRSFATDYSTKKINVNSLVLGYFPTKMTSKSFKDKLKKKLVKRNTILNRWGKLDEIIGPIEFLLSSKSSYITGQSIVVDGGWIVKGLK